MWMPETNDPTQPPIRDGKREQREKKSKFQQGSETNRLGLRFFLAGVHMSFNNCATLHLDDAFRSHTIAHSLHT